MATGAKDVPAQVARDVSEVPMAGDDHLVSGSKSNVQGAATTVLPDTVVAKRHRGMAEPGSAEK